MSQEISPIIDIEELKKLNKLEALVIIDASNGPNANRNYSEKHLQGALFVDLNTQLADIQKDVSIGGRHPLPSIENFAETVSKLGISSKSHVVIYDDNNGSNAAARFWWMMKSIGHEKVQVINGGLRAAEKNNYPLSAKLENSLYQGKYPFKNWKLPIADLHQVEIASISEKYKIVDVRDSKRFKGEIEPIDLIAGHIPGAINIPFHENLDENGLFLSPNILKEKYEKIIQTFKSDHVIVHCGSGVTACHTLLAIAYAGLEIPKLFVGSWSEWSRNKKEIVRN